MRRPSAQALVVRHGRILLLQRGPTAPWAPGRWCLPGGYIDRGETPAQAVVREISEEVGIDWPYHIRYAGPLHRGQHIFIIRRPTHYPFDVHLRDKEHTRWAWVLPKQAHHYPLAPGVADVIWWGFASPHGGLRSG